MFARKGPMPRVPVRDNSWLPSVCLNSFISLILAWRCTVSLYSLCLLAAPLPQTKRIGGGRGRPPETARGNEMVPKNMQKMDERLAAAAWLECRTGLDELHGLLDRLQTALSPVHSKGSPYSTAERRVPELIPVLGSQPAGDVSHKPGGRLPLLSARPAVTLAALKRAATNFAAWRTEARREWTVCLRLLPTASRLQFEPRPFCAWVQHANHSATEPPGKRIIVFYGGRLWKQLCSHSGHDFYFASVAVAVDSRHMTA